MSERNLNRTVGEVFGDVEKGTECRICGRDVSDGRAKTCSDFCSNLQSAVMGFLSWSSVRRKIIARDNETCQSCGFDFGRERRARGHIKARIEAQLPARPEGPSALELGRSDDADADFEAIHDQLEKRKQRREELTEKYGAPYDYARELEVDHITPVADGGHPFDPGNLQTLCEICHEQKTTDENSERAQTPSRGELSKSLSEFVSDEA